MTRLVIPGQRGHGNHLTPKEKADLHKDLEAGKSIAWVCSKYCISSRVAYAHLEEALSGTVRK